jgi:hypothetical protein
MWGVARALKISSGYHPNRFFGGRPGGVSYSFIFECEKTLSLTVSDGGDLEYIAHDQSYPPAVHVK